MININLYQGDCLEEYKKIKENSIDLILTDPPYGIIKKIGKKTSLFKKNTEWDNIIDIKEMFYLAKKTLRQNGRLILFCQEPFTQKLLNYNYQNDFYFNYKLYYIKNNFSSPFNCEKSFKNVVEEILVFTKKEEDDFNNEYRKYFSNIREFLQKEKKLTLKEIDKKMGSSTFSRHILNKGCQFNFPSEKQYNNLIEKLNINEYEYFKTYNEIKNIFNKNKKPLIFNLPENQKSVINTLYFKKDFPSLHPTQKTVELLKFLINIFTNKNNNVLDFTAGSGSTGIACIQTERNCFLIEKDNDFFKIIENRIKEELEKI